MPGGKWYYYQSGHSVGPVTLTELQRKVVLQQLWPEDMVFSGDAGSWRKVSEVPELEAETARIGALTPESAEEVDKLSEEAAPVNSIAKSAVLLSESPKKVRAPRKRMNLLDYRVPGTLVALVGGVVLLVALVIIFRGRLGRRGGQAEHGPLDVEQTQQAQPPAAPQPDPAVVGPLPQTQDPMSAERDRDAELEANRNKPATVMLTITYKQDDAAGGRADSGALVFLVPRSRDRSKLIGSTSTVGFATVRAELGEEGIFCGDAGADGTVAFTDIKPGKYWLYIISKNTHGNGVEQEAADKVFEPLFEDWAAVRGQRLYWKLVDVNPGEETTLTHDFGARD